MTSRHSPRMLHAMRSRPFTLFLAVALAGPALADTIVLTNGKRIENVVVSRQDGAHVVINPFHSRHPEMEWGIEEKHKIRADLVAEVIRSEPPLVEYRERTSPRNLTVEQRLELARFCDEHKLKEERLHELRMALCLDPENEEALKEIGTSKWKAWSRGNPLADAELAKLERDFVTTEDEAALGGLWREMKKLRTTRSLEHLMRARRSGQQPKGRRDGVPLSVRSTEAVGATYCLFVPSGYDPLVPTPLVIGLHGGGPGGRDPTLVTGKGEEAMNFYSGLAEARGWIVACPSALRAGWSHPMNEPLMDGLLEELGMLYNVDETRIYLVGHSMGGFGAWHWGPKRAEVWAACAPCAGGGGPNGIDSKGLPVYVFHGTDDNIVGCGSDRSAAKSLQSSKSADFVYTEITGVGHGFPDLVRQEIFRFFAGRRKDDGRKRALEPRSTFDRKVSRVEAKLFGDPSALDEGGGDAGVKELAAALAAGGGGAEKAADALAEIGTKEAAKAAGNVLRSSRTSEDAKVHAARALGKIALPESVTALAGATRSESFRVVDAATEALGATALPEAAEHLDRMGRRMGEFYEASFFSGSTINFTEYEIRLNSFRILVTALRAVGDAGAAMSILEREIVSRVYDPKGDLYTVAGDQDPRFRNVSPTARRRLAEAVAECCAFFADKRAVPLLDRMKTRWASEAGVVSAVDEALGKLRG